jgi:hypothetical protein
MPAEHTLIGHTIDSDGPIHKALRLLGVTAKFGLDEFDTVELGKFRDFDELFEAYPNAP